MDEILAAVYRGALTATEMAIEALQDIDGTSHDWAEAVDKVFHDKLNKLLAVAADLRKRLGIEQTFGASAADGVAPHAPAAAAFVDSLGPSGS